MPQKIEISHRTIIFTVFFLAFLWFLFQMRQIILLLYISFILMSALNPLVNRLERLKIPRTWAILILYLLFFSFLGLIVGSLLPALVEQTRRLLERLPIISESLDFARIDQSAISSQLGSLPEKLLRLITALFSNFIAVFAFMVIAFYLLVERKRFSRYLFVLFGDKDKDRAERIINKIENQLGAWVRGQAILCTLIGLTTYVGLRFLGIDFALPLSLLAAILEIVPNIGPVISAIPAILIGLASSPISAVAVTALYFLVQQVENYLIVPNVMKRAVNLSPLIVILSLMVGFKMGGVFGALLSVPTVLILRVIFLEILTSKNFQEA
jgi:predicted PurR-regulated permease PerM